MKQTYSRALGVAWVLALALLLPAPPAFGSEGASAEAVEETSPSVGESLDLEEAIALALRSNPFLRAEEERQREVAAQVKEARADAFPQVSAVGGWERSRNPAFLNSADFEDFVEAFPGGTFEPAPSAVYRWGVEMRQPLFTFGKTRAAVDLASTALEVTDAQVEAVRLDVALEAAEAFFELLRARRALEALEIQERGRREALEVVQARYDLGEATELERLRASASLAQVRPRQATLEGDLAVAAGELRRVLGLEGSLPASPADPAGVLSDAATLPQAPTLDALLGAAHRRRPELRDLALQRRALGERQRVIRADAKPRLDFSGVYGHTARQAEDLSDTLFQDWSVSFDLSWLFFDGGRRKAQLEQLESRRRQLVLLLDDQESRVRQELETAAAAYASARESWLASQTSAAAAREAARVAGESYQEGVALQADLLDAQQRATEAELVLVGAYFDARIEAARLHRAAGLLPTEGWSAGPAPADLIPDDPTESEKEKAEP